MRKLFTIIFSVLISCSFAQWYPQNSGTTENLLSVCFTDTLNGWVVGNNGIILHTDNGGINWDVQTSNTDEILTGVYFTDSIHGWIAGHIPQGYFDDCIFYRTLDGGNNWEQIDLGYRCLKEIYFSDTLNGWSVGINHTSDGGETWETQFNAYHDTGGVYFTDSLNGWVVGSTMNGSTGYIHSIILHTNNGGNTWDYQFDINSHSCPALLSVYFTDTLKGWSVGGLPILYEIILKTTDGGNNWDTAYINNYGCLRSIYFADTFNGLAVGYNGSILYTSNGGNTWESEPSGTTYTLNSVYFTENGYAWAVGAGGTIIHADYSQIVGLHEFGAQGLKFSDRCYPNPFTTSTTLSYKLKQPGKVTLSIYNHLGQLVYQTQKNQPQGKQQLIWNGEGFADGVYYYTLQAGEHVANGKLVKVR